MRVGRGVSGSAAVKGTTHMVYVQSNDPLCEHQTGLRLARRRRQRQWQWVGMMGSTIEVILLGGELRLSGFR